MLACEVAVGHAPGPSTLASRPAKPCVDDPAKAYHVTTFGCQMNEHDSERMKGMLESLGYEEVAERGAADLILFNTCSIRESADNRFIAHLGRGEAAEVRGPGAGRRRRRLLGAVGEGRGLRALPVRRRRLRPGQIHRLADFLTQDSLTAQGYFEFEGFSGHLPAKREREFQGWVQISVGCNCVCAYCIVPQTRGREVSRDPGELIAEIEGLAADGVREVTLLGQNVNSYGRDLPQEERITLRRAARPRRRGRRASSASATRAPIPRTCART